MAYAKALEKLTGVEMTKMLPIPNLENEAFSETRKFEEKGLHRAIYRFSPNNYKEIDKIWSSVHPEDGQQFKKSKTTKLLPSERYSLVFLVFSFIRCPYCFKNTINLLDHTKVALDKNYCKCTIGITQSLCH